MLELAFLFSVVSHFRLREFGYGIRKLLNDKNDKFLAWHDLCHRLGKLLKRKGCLFALRMPDRLLLSKANTIRFYSENALR